MKKSKNWKEKKEEKNQDILQKKYVYTSNINKLIKQTYDYNFLFNFYSFEQLS